MIGYEISGEEWQISKILKNKSKFQQNFSLNSEKFMEIATNLYKFVD